MSCIHADLASLYALELLDRHDARMFEDHIESCTFCTKEVKTFVEVSACLALSAPMNTPPEAVRTKLLQSIDSSFDIVLVRHSEAVWQQFSDGVSTRWLFTSNRSTRATLMLKIGAGYRVSLHTFNDPLQIYMLRGNASVGGCVINSGEFLSIADETFHINALSDAEIFVVGHKQMLGARTTVSESLHAYCYEQLPCYAIDDLSMSDWRIVSEHVVRCKSCQENLEGLYTAVGALALSVELLEPSVEVKAKLMTMVSGRQSTGTVVRAQEGRWEYMLDGIYLKKLFLDERRGLATVLYRLDPGAIIPTHPHANIEECLVLEGSFRSSQEIYRAGDYMCMPPRTIHESLITPNGAVMLIVERPAA